MAGKLKTINTDQVKIEKNFNVRNAELVEPIDNDLIASVKGVGVMIPLHVRTKKGKYFLIAGERRLRSAIAAEVLKVPVIDYGEISDTEAHDIAFAENFARKDLTAIEAGKAAKTLVEQYKGDYEAVASKLGKSVGWVKQRVRIIDNLDEEVLHGIENEYPNFTASHLQIIAAFAPDMQWAILNQLYDSPTVEDVRQVAVEVTHCLKFAPWPVDEEVGNISACSNCRFRSSANPGLFDDITVDGTLTTDDRCTDKDCWKAKKQQWLKIRFDVEKKNYPELQLATVGSYYCYGGSELEDLGGQVPLQFAKLKKTAGKNSIPVMVIDDIGFGQIRYVAAQKEEETGSSEEKKTGGKKTMEEKRKGLNSKRFFLVLDWMRSMVCDMKLVELYQGQSQESRCLAVFALAASFGALLNNRYGRDDNGWAMFDRLKGLLGGKEDMTQLTAIAEEIFEMVKVPLVEEISYYGPVTMVPDEKIESAKRIAIMFAIDIDELFEKACQKYKEPKAWANQKESEPHETKS